MRGLAVFSLLSVLLGGLPARADEKTTAVAYYGGLVVGDLAATKYALDHNPNAMERNYKSVAHAAIGSVVLVTGLTAADVWLGKRDRKARNFFRVAVGVGFGGLMVNSYLKARR